MSKFANEERKAYHGPVPSTSGYSRASGEGDRSYFVRIEGIRESHLQQRPSVIVLNRPERRIRDYIDEKDGTLKNSPSVLTISTPEQNPLPWSYCVDYHPQEEMIKSALAFHASKLAGESGNCLDASDNNFPCEIFPMPKEGEQLELEQDRPRTPIPFPPPFHYPILKQSSPEKENAPLPPEISTILGDIFSCVISTAVSNFYRYGSSYNSGAPEPMHICEIYLEPGNKANAGLPEKFKVALFTEGQILRRALTSQYSLKPPLVSRFTGPFLHFMRCPVAIPVQLKWSGIRIIEKSVFCLSFCKQTDGGISFNAYNAPFATPSYGENVFSAAALKHLPPISRQPSFSYHYVNPTVANGAFSQQGREQQFLNPPMTQGRWVFEEVINRISSALSLKCVANYCWICGHKCKSLDNLQYHLRREHVDIFEHISLIHFHCRCYPCIYSLNKQFSSHPTMELYEFILIKKWEPCAERKEDKLTFFKYLVSAGGGNQPQEQVINLSNAKNNCNDMEDSAESPYDFISDEDDE